MTTVYDILQTSLHDGLMTLQQSGQLPDTLSLENVTLEQPKDAAHGHFATNAALVLAKQAKMNPRALAELLVPSLETCPAVDAAEIAGPGFVNIRLSAVALQGELLTILQQKNSYGQVDISKGRKAMVEYVSINPTGPIHVGHGRNAVFGDAIANMLQKAGFGVFREYLLNDAGGQIRILVNSLHARYLQQFGQDVHVPENGYPGDYLVQIAKDLKVQDGDKWLHVTDEKELLKGLRFFAVEACMKLIRADLKTMGMEFDRYFSEYEMHQTDKMAIAIADLREKGYIYEGTLPPPKGKEVENYEPVELTLFKATAFGLAEDQPVYKRNGEPTYFGQDIAYHKDKLDRGFELLTTVIGADQAGSFKPLAKAIEALTGKKDLYHPVPYEMVKVLRDGQPVRMSKRAGNFILLKDVLEEVGVDVFRFTMLSYKPTTQLNFDLAKVVEKSMDNPVFYVQYAHARMASVFRQAEEMRFSEERLRANSFDGTDTSVLQNEGAQALMRTLVLYPMVVSRAAAALEPHRLAFYAQDLASAFHSWYNAEKFLDVETPEATAARLVLVKAAQTVLADVLQVCGVSAPEKM